MALMKDFFKRVSGFPCLLQVQSKDCNELRMKENDSGYGAAATKQNVRVCLSKVDTCYFVTPDYCVAVCSLCDRRSSDAIYYVNGTLPASSLTLV